jgi:hypothetical protein
MHRWLLSVMAKIKNWSKRPSGPRPRRRARPNLERLEDRLVPAISIAWTNAGDDAGFGMFGAQAGLA